MWQDSLWPLWSRFLPSLIYDTFRALHKTECFPSHSFISSKHNHLALNHCSAQSCKYIFPHFGYTHLYRKAANANLPHPIVWHWLPLTPSTITLQTFQLALNQTKSNCNHEITVYILMDLLLWYSLVPFGTFVPLFASPKCERQTSTKYERQLSTQWTCNTLASFKDMMI